MDTGMLVLGIVLVGVLGFIAYQIYMRQQSPVKQAPLQQQQPPSKPTVIVVSTPSVSNSQPVDPRFFPTSPEQSYNTPPDLRGFPSVPIAAGGGAIPINQMTRGVPDQFQQIGVLTAPGGTETSATPTRTILPLFGRKLATNRDRWNYYTRTDGMNPVQVPLEYKRRKCDDDVGCDEIMEGETVSVPIMGQSYVASVYRYSVPRYIPAV
jgi:hypothetical protein